MVKSVFSTFLLFISPVRSSSFHVLSELPVCVERREGNQRSLPPNNFRMHHKGDPLFTRRTVHVHRSFNAVNVLSPCEIREGSESSHICIVWGVPILLVCTGKRTTLRC